MARGVAIERAARACRDAHRRVATRAQHPSPRGWLAGRKGKPLNRARYKCVAIHLLDTRRSPYVILVTAPWQKPDQAGGGDDPVDHLGLVPSKVPVDSELWH